MKTISKNNSRGLTELDWLVSFHSFSFGNYFDQSKLGSGPLRVINEDLIAPKGGFPAHPHKNMEIITIVLDGELSHKDSAGHEETIKYGEIQKMSAGSGIFHSEFNNSSSERVRLLQIWIVPDKLNIEPSYEKISFLPSQFLNNLYQIAGQDKKRPVFLNQNVRLFFSEFEKDTKLEYDLSPGRQAYIHIIDGSVEIDNNSLGGGDAIETDDAGQIHFKFTGHARFLLFDLPAHY